jgi:23S rRNA (pseudouridine1915-N3)-methyltransferase
LYYTIPLMKIKLICISDSDKHFASAVEEYCKRLWKDVEIFSLKPERNGSRDQIIAKETEKIIEKLSTIKDSYTILLAKEGKQISTESLVDLVAKHNSLVFVIWWPYGIDHPTLEKHIHQKIAFGEMTMPHWLAKLVILEQVYRVKMIGEGREYHY